jgi:Leucine-rich repeat (LRR) protein
MKIRPQFGLKFLFLVTTLIAVFAATLGKPLHDRWRSQQELAAQEKTRLRLMELGFRFHSSRRYPAGSVNFSTRFREKKLAHADFQLLSQLSPFESIDLPCTGLADEDLPVLSGCSELKILRVEGNPGISDKGVKYLAQFTELEELNLGKTGITDESLKDIAKLFNLKRLFLTGKNLSSRGLADLGPLPALQLLLLSDLEINDEGLRAIADIEGLESLFLCNAKVHGHGISALRGLSHLKSVDMHRCELDDGSGMADLHQVESLSLNDSKIPPGFLRHVAKMRGLRTLSLIDSPITNEHLADLGEATQLTRLTYRGTLVSDQGLVHLENLKQLEFLGLRKSNITPASAEALAAKLSNTLIMTDHGDYNRAKFGWKNPTKRGEPNEYGRLTP